MKKVLILAIALVVQTTFAQVTKSLGDFNTVKVFDKLEVKLIASNENKAVVSGTRESEVEFVNKNGELKIRMPFPKLLSGDAISVKLYFKSIDGVEASEGSFVSSDATFKGTIMDISAREGSQINLELDGVQKVNVRAVTGGIVALSGSAVNQDVVIMSGGILNAKDLKSAQISISVSAGGSAEINASVLVDAKVKAGGSIYVYGSPEQINKETLFGGKIIEKN
ncbi:head GIN domain-containing protein [Flavobacterium muglaense]|uniref:DUF2807 domain-containing protein n=1 Tax=Flavobacterium muglaense TaxID=2764716 RepID=A0A923N518_9FLAO|nr:head GIN domain-containing protein [Flavobacterium muglaense]MBC5839613.1 DUF2807 domain-containing protein [Flavobacterium muglaense]MBC5846140.1 DUF2807 domain-containing protein [Flavobacterium muglaense]